ncbi:hypothetical protein [Pararhizobium qamdonense]|uniref:hypothetical protein n=1 Tax=Pararhizobium qamdonense TaxID=3031126 RepID=UPI0023E2F456|nr:hypothetical protein [Pararhizobium qamdonense]
MDKHLLRIFQMQVLDQCKYLLASAKGIDAGLANMDVDQTMYFLQNLLNAGANISKMLWGQRGKKANDRALLRASIGISDGSPLRQVTMRNNFEHMDERIDKWWRESENKNYVDKNFGSKESFLTNQPIDKFRIFDPKSRDIIFWGEEFSTQDLVTEALRIMPILKREIYN